MAEIEKVQLTSLDIKENQVAKMKEIFPEVFTERNKIDWDKLRLTLGENIDAGKERYGMNWPGKADCFKTIQQPSIATLVPDREESVEFDATENLFIEGDNLEVLKLLQKSYLGKVKMIYIDPPYNTGNDFIYPDNYAENLSTYLEYTGQLDSEGRKFATNTDTDGRFHSKWMNMMYPRLFLARNLLCEDGFIFISIDDNEVHNLKAICNEIFGEENFIEQFIWKKRYGGGAKEKHIVNLHEYILFYAKNKETVNSIFIPSNPEFIRKYYTKRDNKFEKRGPYRLQPLEAAKSMGERKNLVFEILTPSGNKIMPKRQWLWSKERVNEALKNDDLEIITDKDGNTTVNIKQYLRDENGVEKQLKVTSIVEDIFTQHGTKEIEQLFNSVDYFSYPKPTALIRHLISFTTKPSDYILDFFAGSGTTAHAILTLDIALGSRKFICVQLPEPTVVDSESFRAGFKSISDISKERIRRVIQTTKLNRKRDESLFSTNESYSNRDLGFKVFILKPSNFKVWDSSIDKQPASIQKLLFEHVEHVSAEAQQEAILYELLLKSGFELTTKVETQSMAGKTVYSIADGELLICLEKQLTNDVIKEMAERQPSRVICLDEGFSGKEADALKTNAVQIMKSKGVLNFRTV